MNAFITDTSAQDVHRPARKARKRLLIAGVGVGVMVAIYALVSFSAALSADRFIPREELRFAPVERGELTREVAAQGRVVVANSPTLFSPEQGYVNLQVKAGDVVQKGQLLAKVKSPELGELLAREQSELTRMQVALAQQAVEARQQQTQREQAVALAKVELQASEREKRRAERSRSLHLISEFDYEEVVDNLERARLEHQQALQNLTLSEDSQNFYRQSLALQVESQQLVIKALERRVEALTISSPVDGMVGNVEVNESQAVAANQALISVVDLTAFEIEASVAEGLAGDIAPGMDAEVALTGQAYPGVVKAVSPEVVRGEVVVRIGFVGQRPESLRQNQRLSARILLEQIPDTLMVQRGPFFDGFQGYVFKVVDERAVRVAAATGARSLRSIEITDGLAVGDTIIVSEIPVDGEVQQIRLTH